MLDNERTLVELKRRIILIVRARQRIIIADNPCDNGDRFRAGFVLVVRGRFGEIGRASCRERVERAVVGVASRRRHTRYIGDWSSDVCSSDLSRSREGMSLVDAR